MAKRKKQSVDVMEFGEDAKKIGVSNITFAHVPKEIKKMIKPN